ncbi:unnamed protein product [Ophioblennius macclurei]
MASWITPADDSPVWFCLDGAVAVWSAVTLVFVIVPTALGDVSGVNSFYLRTLVKMFEWATSRMELRAKEKNQQLYKPYATGLIDKEPIVSMQQEIQKIRHPVRDLTSKSEFELVDVLFFCRRGVESVVDDEVTKRFSAQELDGWNLMTRSSNKNNFRHVAGPLAVLWGLGILVRYAVLLPVRILIAAAGICLFLVSATFVGFIPHTKLRSYLSEKVQWLGCRICVTSLTAIITYHHRENKPKNDGICVANHTTPLDVIFLSNDGNCSMVGQMHGGLFGMIQRAMLRCSAHIWFERTEAGERHLVVKRLRDHVADKTKPPPVVFPEGTCINNTSVMMFRKGAFEVGCTVYPVAIKYDSRFGEAFWNSSKFGLVVYLLTMMSSWAVVCSVWYLPPMEKQEGEDAVQFANRVKAAIAVRGGLVDLIWDGKLKRANVKKTYKEEQQRLYSRFLVDNCDVD